MPGVRGDSVLQILEGLEVLGNDPSDILRAAGVAPAALEKPESWISPDIIERLLQAAEQLSGDSLVGLHCGAVPVDQGWLAYVGMTEGTVEGSLKRYAADVALVAPGVRFELTQGADLACFRVEMSAPRSALAGSIRQASEYIAGQTVSRYLRWAKGFRSSEVRLPHPAGGPVAEYERVLEAPVRFEQAALEIDIPRECLDLRLQSANPRVALALEQEARERRSSAELSDAVEDALRRLLDQRTEVSLHGLAKGMGIGERTLQRRLRESGLNYRGILDQLRRELAVDALASGDVPVSDISEQLGFSDATAFGKAFHRWFATSPTAFRRSHV